MSELLARNKSGTLSHSEEVERDQYLLLEHWVLLAKAYAYKRLLTDISMSYISATLR